jgi:hypothetical protein
MTGGLFLSLFDGAFGDGFNTIRNEFQTKKKKKNVFRTGESNPAPKDILRELYHSSK